LLLFALATIFLFLGFCRGFAADRPHPKRSRTITSLVGVLSVVIFGLFIFTIFVAGRWLPASTGAPQVGQRAPDFTLTDTSGKSVSLSQLLSEPVSGNPPRGVLLVFYRGYW
jgi:hypothetical protein